MASTAESRWGPGPSRPRAGSRSWTLNGKGDGYDGLSAWTQVQLETLLEQLLENPADDIFDAGDDEPSGNWSGQVWAWDYDTTQYVLLAPWSF